MESVELRIFRVRCSQGRAEISKVFLEGTYSVGFSPMVACYIIAYKIQQIVPLKATPSNVLPLQTALILQKS